MALRTKAYLATHYITDRVTIKIFHTYTQSKNNDDMYEGDDNDKSERDNINNNETAYYQECL